MIVSLNEKQDLIKFGSPVLPSPPNRNHNPQAYVTFVKGYSVGRFRSPVCLPVAHNSHGRLSSRAAVAETALRFTVCFRAISDPDRHHSAPRLAQNEVNIAHAHRHEKG